MSVNICKSLPYFSEYINDITSLIKEDDFGLPAILNTSTFTSSLFDRVELIRAKRLKTPQPQKIFNRAIFDDIAEFLSEPHIVPVTAYELSDRYMPRLETMISTRGSIDKAIGGEFTRMWGDQKRTERFVKVSIADRIFKDLIADTAAAVSKTYAKKNPPKDNH